MKNFQNNGIAFAISVSATLFVMAFETDFRSMIQIIKEHPLYLLALAIFLFGLFKLNMALLYKNLTQILDEYFQEPKKQIEQLHGRVEKIEQLQKRIEKVEQSQKQIEQLKVEAVRSEFSQKQIEQLQRQFEKIEQSQKEINQLQIQFAKVEQSQEQIKLLQIEVTRLEKQIKKLKKESEGDGYIA
jgi:DNA repair exonuclease SbcCD ATPase subunit